MQRLLFSLLLMMSFSLTLFASQGVTQEHLVSISPAENTEAVKPETLVQVTFDREIVESSVVDDTITLTPINPEGEKVSTEISISDNSTLVCTPNELLQEGEYRVTVKPVVLQANKDDYQLSSWIEKLIYFLCSWFYDDISECPLYQQFFVIPSLIKTELIEYSFTVVDKPEILSIKLNATSLELNEGETTQLNAVAIYDDNTSRDITQEALWSIDNPSVASIDTNATLKTLQEGSAQITASLESITSQTLLLNVRKTINGHLLPPAPAPILNNATLLGIDSNNNGVRDDVERWIYTYYSKPIEHAVFMQSAKAYQIVIQEPEKALENLPTMQAATRCESYWSFVAKDESKPFWLEEYKDYEKEISPIQFNTADRFLAYKKYNQTLSGGVYGDNIEPEDWIKSCDFNSSDLIKTP